MESQSGDGPAVGGEGMTRWGAGQPGCGIETAGGEGCGGGGIEGGLEALAAGFEVHYLLGEGGSVSLW